MKRVFILTEVFNSKPVVLTVSENYEDCMNRLQDIANNGLRAYKQDCICDDYFMHIRFTFPNSDVLPYDYYVQGVDSLIPTAS